MGPLTVSESTLTGTVGSGSGEARKESFGVTAVDAGSQFCREGEVLILGTHELHRRRGGEGEVRPEDDPAGVRDGEQAEEGRRRRGEGGVVPEPFEHVHPRSHRTLAVEEEAGHLDLRLVAQGRQDEAVGDIRHEAAGVGEDEPNPGIPLEGTRRHQAQHGAGGLEEEVRGEAGDPLDRLTGQLTGVDEDHGAAFVEEGQQLRKAGSPR